MGISNNMDIVSVLKLCTVFVSIITMSCGEEPYSTGITYRQGEEIDLAEWLRINEGTVEPPVKFEEVDLAEFERINEPPVKFEDFDVKDIMERKDMITYPSSILNDDNMKEFLEKENKILNSDVSKSYDIGPAYFIIAIVCVLLLGYVLFHCWRCCQHLKKKVVNWRSPFYTLNITQHDQPLPYTTGQKPPKPSTAFENPNYIP